ncbi:hypothetical protein VHEMI01363 [[Torrubiella] hemipterigena]|uniref:Uncharacterized protein n=1 Tax=[Torrubiella] hemipterigena TaxID=1531966 RepID=A0A0A1SSX6_9HYPO|nr:hypothetical protein VHEMI01363 [[Torrubiella] hemipterigena]
MFPLLSLHSMQTFHCHSACLGEGKTEWDMYEQYPAVRPNLQGLYVHESVITSQNAGRLFEYMRHLRTLRFVYSESALSEFYFNANGFVRHLVAGVGDALEDLSLVGLESIGSVDIVRYPLNGFKKLRRLELDLAYFISTNVEWDPDAREDEGDVLCYGEEDGDSIWGSGDDKRVGKADNRFVGHLMAATGDTLEDFELTAGDLHSDTVCIRCPLHKFKRLSRLEIDTSFFINSKVVVGEDENYQSDERDDGIWGTEAVPQDDAIWRAYEISKTKMKVRGESKQKEMKEG